MRFKLRFPQRDIRTWSDLYDYSKFRDDIPLAMCPAARARGHLTRKEFLDLTRWKSPRTQSRCAANDAEFIEAVTATALSSPNERVRIEVLTLLTGVSWPTASVILHFCAQDPYPILDFRALWSLSWEQSPVAYNFALWWDYCIFTRKLATKAGVSMRVLDRALWQYSKENQ